MFYYTLGNLRPELRSTHRSIQLIACVTSPILEKYGFELVLKPFIEDINDLSVVWNMYTIAIILLLYIACNCKKDSPKTCDSSYQEYIIKGERESDELHIIC